MEEQNFDNSKLHEYLKQNLAEFPRGNEELKMFKFSGGFSNPTFLMQKNGKEFVLRQRSPRQIHVGLHKVDIEYKVMSFLGATSFPVPKMYLYCDDTSILGQDFFVMEYVKGRLFESHNLPGLSPEERKSVFEAAIRALAQLQNVNLDGFDVEGMGDRDNYLKEKLDLFEEGYKKMKKEIPKAYRLLDWLKENIPTTDRTQAVIHKSDFRFPNFIIHPEKPEILAVLDWEGAGWGHPFEDLFYLLNPFHFPTIPGFNYHLEGIPSEEALLSLYSDLTGASLPLTNWNFFLGLAYFNWFLNMQTFSAVVSGKDFSERLKAIGAKFESYLEPFVEHACGVLGIE